MAMQVSRVWELSKITLSLQRPFISFPTQSSSSPICRMCKKNILVQSLPLYAQPEVGKTCQENEQFPNLTNDWLRAGCTSKDENVKSFNTQLLKQQTLFHNFKNMTSLPRDIKISQKFMWDIYLTCVHVCICVYAMYG